jgi:hypothetical protein
LRSFAALRMTIIVRLSPVVIICYTKYVAMMFMMDGALLTLSFVLRSCASKSDKPFGGCK